MERCKGFIALSHGGSCFPLLQCMGGYGTDSDPLVILHPPAGLLVKVTPQVE